jgi:competence protein ComEC
MTHYSHIPLVRIFIPLLAGVISYTYLELHLSVPVFVIVFLLFLVSGLLVNRYFLPKFHLSFLYGLNVMLFLVCVGYFLAQTRNDLHRKAHFSHFQWQDSMLRMKLTEPVAEKTNSFQVVGRVTHVVAMDSIIPVRGRIMVWLQKDSLSATLEYGDVIMMENDYQPVRAPQNPNVFDYRRFLSRQNIFHQAYRRSGDWYFTGKREGNLLVAASHHIRQAALETLEANNIQGKDFAVASALMLGYREYLDEDLQREFAGAGAMHILCVSGLHVGIIFMALNLMFSFLNKIPRGKYLKTVLIVLLIWLYAAITGFSPSVMRASTMFSFVAMGQTFSRSTNIYNTLAASALVLVIIDPMIITRLGFQLSYIAVISIVSLQPLFFKQLYFKNWLLKGGWAIITVSLAAQLGTGPMALHYFNQFPNYFLLTNLIVIPLTGFIIKGGIILFLVSPVEFLSQYVGVLLSWIVLVLHSLVRFIEGLPGSTALNLVLTFNEKLLVFAIIAVGAMYFYYWHKRFIFLALTGCLLLVGSFTYRAISAYDQRQLVVYQVPNATAIDIISRNDCFTYTCPVIQENPSLVSFHVHSHRLKSGVGSVEPVLLNGQQQFSHPNVVHRDHFIGIDGHAILIIDGEAPIVQGQYFPGQISHLIIRNNARVEIELLQQVFNPQMIVFDSSNSLRRSRQWVQECDSLGLACWSVGLHGAYVFDMKSNSAPALFASHQR